MNEQVDPDAVLARWDAYQYRNPTELAEALRLAIQQRDALQDRLEVDPTHRYDGIAARDQTIRLLEQRIKEAAELRGIVDALLEIAEQCVDTRQCSVGILRAMNDARRLLSIAKAEQT